MNKNKPREGGICPTKKVTAVILSVVIIGLTACGNALPPSSPSSSQTNTQAPAPSSAVSEPSQSSAESGSASLSNQSGAVDVILAGFSAKAFQAGEIAEEDMQTILQCGAKAPSARNLQPWHFTVIRDGKTAKSLIRDCPDGGVVIVVSGSEEQAKGMDVSFDCGLATQNMYIAAQALGLGAHIYLGGVQDANNKKDALGIPAGYDAKMLLLIGRLKDDVDAVTSASIRNPLAETVNYIG